MILWTNWSNPYKPALAALLFFSTVWGQDLNYYFDLAYQGEPEKVAEALPRLYRENPNDGAVLYLEGLITSDGDAAVEIYKRVVNLYSSSPYADDALLKIGELLYARGLYVQAAQYLKRIPIHYPQSDLVYPGIRLFLNSLLVSGDRDTAFFYVQVFSRRYPEIEFDLNAGRASSGPVEGPTITEIEHEPTRFEQESNAISGTGSGFRLQAGAFSLPGNAERRQDMLESLNYSVEIEPSTSMSGRLYLVIVNGFDTREEADNAVKLLGENYGIEAYVITGD